MEYVTANIDEIQYIICQNFNLWLIYNYTIFD